MPPEVPNCGNCPWFVPNLDLTLEVTENLIARAETLEQEARALEQAGEVPIDDIRAIEAEADYIKTEAMQERGLATCAQPPFVAGEDTFCTHESWRPNT